MKKIGFVDYYISEWHANNYPEWIREANEKLGEDFEIAYAWAELDKSLVDGVTTDEWCEKFGVERCETLESLCEKSDYILVLAPSNPEKHLGYAETVLKYGKNTYIDKTFAPDFATAKRIFDIAEENGTRFFSSSALRYSTELDTMKNTVKADVKGGGSNIAEYIIHQVEMLVKVMKKDAKRVRVEQTGDNEYKAFVDFGNDEPSTLFFSPNEGFAVCATASDGSVVDTYMYSDFFRGLIADILRFYSSGEASFDTNETLSIMKIREAVVNGVNTLGEWTEI